jgi:hypothetical protein
MIIYSPFFKPIFWIIMGLMYAMTLAGAPLWAEDLGLQMSWWKWLIIILWYAILNFSFAGAFTLLGEKEPGAWYKFLGFHLIIMAAFGFVVWFLIF